MALLEVNDLRVSFFLRDRTVRAVDGVSFVIEPGEIVGLVGESGCGKSVTARCILGMLPAPGKIIGGEIWFKKENLLTKSREEMRNIRGKQISIVVQDALAALNPVIPTGEQVADVYMAHHKTTRKSAWQRAVDMFRRVGIRNADHMVHRYPHEFSGGMRQRTVLASALTGEPELLIADEPTTALDVTIQQQILSLLMEVREQLGTAILYISHDLATVAQLCDRVLIMYAGEIVEHAPVEALFRDPRHPYTRGLLASIPPLEREPLSYLPAISGMPPDPSREITGCRFADRCEFVMDRCRETAPPLYQVSSARDVRCFLESDSVASDQDIRTHQLH